MKHYTVLKNECIDYLQVKENGIYVDATLGYAGDAKEILQRCKKGYLFAFDRDEQSVLYAQEVLEKIGTNFKIFHERFSKMEECLTSVGVNEVDGILFDLGVSSPQLDENRGFTFMRDEKLDMRMNTEDEKSAYDVVNEYSYEELKNIFYLYGEESKSPLIAKKIVEERKAKPIVTTLELVDIIKRSVGAKYFYDKHPERVIFQAIRIEVNEELQEIETALKRAISLLKPGGRLVVVTFHSLEDRLVKKIMKQYSEVDEMVKGLPTIPIEYQPLLKIITKKPILPNEEEIKANSRSKSAKLRVCEKEKEGKI